MTRVWHVQTRHPNGDVELHETVIAEKDEAVAKWKWCEQCEHRTTDAVKIDREIIEGHDRCMQQACGFEYVYPMMDCERRLLSKRCPYYAEALMEQLNESKK
jgi:hypothetical protein